MKKSLLALILFLTAPLSSMDRNPLAVAEQRNPILDISNVSAPLHLFLTEYLDGRRQPEEASVTSVITALKRHNANPAILLTLQDRRPGKFVYDFSAYLREHPGTYLNLTLKETDLLDLNVTVGEKRTYPFYYNHNHGRNLAKIDAHTQDNSTNIMQNGALITSFDLVNNGETKGDDKHYSLIHLLVRLRRPEILQRILDASPSIPVFPRSMPLLKQHCQNNDGSSRALNRIEQRIDEALDVSLLTGRIIKAKDVTINELPTIAVVTAIALGINKNLSRARNATVRNNVGGRRYALAGLFAATGGLYAWEIFELSGFNSLWRTIAHNVQYSLDVDNRITALLARKIVARTLIIQPKDSSPAIAEPMDPQNSAGIKRMIPNRSHFHSDSNLCRTGSTCTIV